MPIPDDKKLYEKVKKIKIKQKIKSSKNLSPFMRK